MQVNQVSPSEEYRLHPLGADGCLSMLSCVAGRWHTVKETSLRTLAEYSGLLEAIGRQTQGSRSERALSLQWFLEAGTIGRTYHGRLF